MAAAIATMRDSGVSNELIVGAELTLCGRELRRLERQLKVQRIESPAQATALVEAVRKTLPALAEQMARTLR